MRNGVGVIPVGANLPGSEGAFSVHWSRSSQLILVVENPTHGNDVHLLAWTLWSVIDDDGPVRNGVGPQMVPRSNRPFSTP
jgi:hypothetical protein